MELSAFDKKSIAREEYEIQHYDFTLREFKEQNFEFVKLKINKAMKDSCKQIIKLFDEINPTIAKNVKTVSKEIASEMNKNCAQGVQKVNGLIDKHCKIPDDVSFEANDEIEVTDEKKLLAECEDLEKRFAENAVFINLLNAEVEASDGLVPIVMLENLIIMKAEEQLDGKFRVDLSNAIAERIPQDDKDNSSNNSFFK